MAASTLVAAGEVTDVEPPDLGVAAGRARGRGDVLLPEVPRLGDDPLFCGSCGMSAGVAFSVVARLLVAVSADSVASKGQ